MQEQHENPITVKTRITIIYYHFYLKACSPQCLLNSLLHATEISHGNHSSLFIAWNSLDFGNYSCWNISTWRVWLTDAVCCLSLHERFVIVIHTRCNRPKKKKEKERKKSAETCSTLHTIDHNVLNVLQRWLESVSLVSENNLWNGQLSTYTVFGICFISPTGVGLRDNSESRIISDNILIFWNYCRLLSFF